MAVSAPAATASQKVQIMSRAKLNAFLKWQEPAVEFMHKVIECVILVLVGTTNTAVGTIRDFNDLPTCSHTAAKVTNLHHRFVPPMGSTRKMHGGDVLVEDSQRTLALDIDNQLGILKATAD
jgi:hypothetical protein